MSTLTKGHWFSLYLFNTFGLNGELKLCWNNKTCKVNVKKNNNVQVKIFYLMQCHCDKSQLILYKKVICGNV